MQQWGYGYLYITGVNVQEAGQSYAIPSGRKVAVVEDAERRRIVGGANTAVDALNALGHAGWIISDGSPRTR
jgi:hypothetical protein